MRNRVIFAAITILVSSCVSTKKNPDQIELSDGNPSYNLIENTDSLYSNSHLKTLDKFAWRWYSPTTVVGSGSEEELIFTGNKHLSIKNTYIRVQADRHIVDSTIRLFEASIDGPILSYGNHATTIYASEGLLLLKAVLPMGNLKWFYKNDDNEYLYNFKDDPFQADSGTVILSRYPHFELPDTLSRKGKFYTKSDKYGMTISIQDLKDPAFNNVYNHPGIYFPKASIPERVGHLSALPGSLSQKMYLRDSL